MKFGMLLAQLQLIIYYGFENFQNFKFYGQFPSKIIFLCVLGVKKPKFRKPEMSIRKRHSRPFRVFVCDFLQNSILNDFPHICHFWAKNDNWCHYNAIISKVLDDFFFLRLSGDGQFNL